MGAGVRSAHGGRVSSPESRRAVEATRKAEASQAVEQARERGIAVQVSGAPVSAQLVELALRRVVNVGPMGAQLGLDSIPGIVAVAVVDHGGAHGAQLEPGTAVVEIRGDPPLELVREILDQHAPAGVLVVPIIRPARRRDRFRAWFRWHWWRLFQDPR